MLKLSHYAYAAWALFNVRVCVCVAFVGAWEGVCNIVMACDAVHFVNAPHLGRPIIHGCIVK